MPEEKPGNKNKTEADKHSGLPVRQADSQPVPAVIERAESPIAYYKPQQDEDAPKNRFWRFLYRRSQVILSLLTFGILVFYAIQWWEFRSTREVENRAYVATRNIQLAADPSVPNINLVFVTLVNTGRTPGLNGNIVGQLELRESSPPENQVVNPPEQPSSKMLFGPQIDLVKGVGAMPSKTLPEPAPQETDTAIPKNGKKGAESRAIHPPAQQPAVPVPPQPVDNRLWYVYGVITYEDVFEKRHQTKFCYRNVPGTGVWWLCPTYNEAN